jgi:hypothetical protein
MFLAVAALLGQVHSCPRGVLQRLPFSVSSYEDL